MKTLYENERKAQKFALWQFGVEVDVRFKPDKDIVLQVTELLKTSMYYFKLYSKEELISMFPHILRAFKFPENTWPSTPWIRMQMNYIRKMKGVNRYYQLKNTQSSTSHSNK